MSEHIATTLPELAHALPAAQEPCRDLDASILGALGHEITYRQTRFTGESQAVVHWKEPHPYAGMKEPCPRLTADLSAAVVLVRQMLPDFGYRLQTQLGGKHPTCTLFAPPEEPDASITDGRSWSKHYDGGGATMALAIMAALMNALIARGEGDNHEPG